MKGNQLVKIMIGFLIGIVLGIWIISRITAKMFG